MTLTNADSLADFKLTMTWSNQEITHTEVYFADEANLYRDFFPKNIAEQLLNKPVGEKISLLFKPGELLPVRSEKNIHRIRPNQCNMKIIPGKPEQPRKGRFYPKGILGGITGVFSENVTPFRVLDADENRVIADFNHPLADQALVLTVEILYIKSKRKERGGACMDWAEPLTSGPGIQSRFEGKTSDFFSDDPFSREDDHSDKEFYAKERLVSHIDELARKNLADFYGQRLKKGSLVLDLMSSWQSHLHDDLALKGLHGIGMNGAEMSENMKLTEYRIHDLNLDPSIPYPDEAFDNVICSLSVEYLTHPFDVFRDVARVLKPGGSFIVAFSNRWFPTKTIRLWPFLHEFERMGLVMEYFLESGKYEQMETMSLRGYPRPYTDDYFPKLKQSDPLYVVQGIKK